MFRQGILCADIIFVSRKTELDRKFSKKASRYEQQLRKGLIKVIKKISISHDLVMRNMCLI